MDDSLNRIQGKRIAESIPVMIFLALSGGLQDAYTYVLRGRVFANAQTGNIVLMSIKLFERDFSGALNYLYPILAFVAGVLATDLIAHFVKKYTKSINWRLIIIADEMAILVISSFIPEQFNPVANAIISFSCAMQVQAFREVNGHEYASTMCIGNLRAGTVALSKWLRTRESEQIKKTLYYFAVIILFGSGAGIGSILMPYLGLKTVLLCPALLLAAFLVILIGQTATDRDDD